MRDDESEPELEREIGRLDVGFERLVISDSQLVRLRSDASGS